MRRLLAPSALAIAALAGIAVASAAGPSSAQKRLENVSVCGANGLDRIAGECRRDESGRPIVSSALNCSARAQGEAGERFAGRFFYRGQPFPAYGTSVGRTPRGLYIFLTTGPNPMPGGSWSCELRVGPERIRKAFRSGGPTGQILHLAACRRSRTVSAGPVRVCRRDESRTPFRPSDTVTCSAVFAGGKGKLVTIEFLRQGREVLSGDFELPLPVTASGPFIRPAPRLQTGSWACRWSLAGRVLAVKRFRIA